MSAGKKFAEFLKNKRVDAGLSQMQVAEFLNYSTPQFISNWERGVSQPPVNSLKRLSLLYKTSAEELFECALEATIEELSEDLKKKFKGSRK